MVNVETVSFRPGYCEARFSRSLAPSLFPHTFTIDSLLTPKAYLLHPFRPSFRLQQNFAFG